MLAAGSASAIVGDTVVGYHVLHIEGYSSIKDCATGHCVNSCRFTVGNTRWRIDCYPNGETSEPGRRCRLTPEPQACAGFPRKAPPRFHVTKHGFKDFVKRKFLEKSEYLKDDCFKIRCDVIIPKGSHTEKRAAAPPAPALVPVPPSDMSRHLGDLLKAEDGADVTFQVAGETFRAHRCVLAARSPVFKAQFFGAMKESSDDNKAAVICVDDMEAEAFEALLAFLYTDSLPQFPGTTESAMNQHLLVAADKYNLERLKLICEDRLCRSIETDTAASFLALAEQHNGHMLRKACIQFISFPPALREVMKTDGFEHLARSCPSVLKELLSNAFSCVNIGQASHEEGKRTTGT